MRRDRYFRSAALNDDPPRHRIAPAPTGCLHLGAAEQRRHRHAEQDSSPHALRRGLARPPSSRVASLPPAGLGNARPTRSAPGVRTQGETKPKGVTDTVLASIDLSKEKVNLKDRQLRIRRLVVQPGGVVPWHSHEDRPALIYIVSGTIQEYASNCSVPIVHKAGEVSVEKLGVQHWWKNTGKAPAVLLSSDVFHEMPQEDEHMM